jgi:hypothetical protein
MTELEEVKQHILERYPEAYDIMSEPDPDWVKNNYEGGCLWTGFDTWKCKRHGGVFAPKPEYMRAYRFKRMDTKTREEHRGVLIVTECPDPLCKDDPHKLCIFY